MEGHLKTLMQNFPEAGVVRWISIRPEKRQAVKVVKFVDVDPEQGLIGDHYHGQSRKRQVTLIQEEHLKTVATFLQKPHVDPAQTRRNIVVSGINLLALKEQIIQIGEAVQLEITGPCPPCSRMEAQLGHGGYNAMRGMGGITARVARGGTIRLGDTIRVIAKAADLTPTQKEMT